MFTFTTIIEKTIIELQTALSNRQVTSEELVSIYLERIAKYDQDGPKLNSILEINPEVLHIARRLDHERNETGSRGPLHGIPIVIKDNIDTNDKMHTSAGSLALANSYAKEDAFIVKSLREAGVIILGKTNLTEWANFMTENMPNGYSSRGGQVLNPYGPGTFNTGGSSAGAGVSVAANLAAAAIGTETSGSILSPSSNNSVVGIKPTVGLVSRTGIIPISTTQDTAGPMTRTVEDAAILLGAITGFDAEDPITFVSKGKATRDYTAYLQPDQLTGARIGIPRGKAYGYLTDDQKQLFEYAVQSIKAAGAEIIELTDLPYENIDWDINVMLYEFKPALNAYLKNVDSHIGINTLQDVIEFNLQHADQALKHGQTLLEKAEATSGSLTEGQYINSLLQDQKYSTQQGIDKLITEHQLDALLFAGEYGSFIPAKAGYPSITVPGGYVPGGAPLGITFTSTAFQEPRLIQLAYSFEQLTKHRKAPKF